MEKEKNNSTNTENFNINEILDSIRDYISSGDKYKDRIIEKNKNNKDEIIKLNPLRTEQEVFKEEKKEKIPEMPQFIQKAARNTLDKNSSEEFLTTSLLKENKNNKSLMSEDAFCSTLGSLNKFVEDVDSIRQSRAKIKQTEKKYSVINNEGNFDDFLRKIITSSVSEWLEKKMPTLVQELVEKEIEEIVSKLDKNCID